jgi:pre-rRNA-processing protein TSR4
MGRVPQQVVRWGIGEKPLWISAAHRPVPEDIPPCPACGARRVMELQIMPTIIYTLKPYCCSHVKGDEGVDIGTATLYSCSEMCRLSGQFCPEYIHIQPPPT